MPIPLAAFYYARGQGISPFMDSQIAMELAIALIMAHYGLSVCPLLLF